MKKLLWLKLDNAAKIYPAVRRKDWTNVFRLSVTFCDPIDPEILKDALAVTVKRFPSVAARMRTGAFWYYLEEIPAPPEILREKDCSLNRMTFESIRKCAFRVLYHENRMSVEIFHSITDGTAKATTQKLRPRTFCPRLASWIQIRMHRAGMDM